MNLKQYFLLLTIVILFSNCGIQKNIDPLELWEFKFSKSENIKDKIGTLILKRKKNIHNKSRTRTITPQIFFDIYPVSFKDSINNIELERLTSISCCYPVCGSTIITTKNYVFWSNPWSIIASFECNGIDYTRRYANLIFEKVENQNFNSIEELISELSIERIKN